MGFLGSSIFPIVMVAMNMSATKRLPTIRFLVIIGGIAYVVFCQHLVAEYHLGGFGSLLLLNGFGTVIVLGIERSVHRHVRQIRKRTIWKPLGVWIGIVLLFVLIGLLSR